MEASYHLVSLYIGPARKTQNRYNNWCEGKKNCFWRSRIYIQTI